MGCGSFCLNNNHKKVGPAAITNEEQKNNAPNNFEKSEQSHSKKNQTLHSTKNPDQANETEYNFIYNNQNPIKCIAIGDIEGNSTKLKQIVNFILTNPHLSFVFIGDLFDDLSDSNPKHSENWNCLEMLSDFFGDDEFTDVSDFQKIHFGYKKFSSISQRVKFIAGNSECDALADVQSSSYKTTDDNHFVFSEKGKWQKTLNESQMILLYRYFKSCHGVIKLKCGNHILYFRHSPSTFKRSKDMIEQIPETKENDNDILFITGHVRLFVSGFSKNPEGKAYIIDTSPKDYNADGDNEDRRIALVSHSPTDGFIIEAFALPGNFPKKTS